MRFCSVNRTNPPIILDHINARRYGTQMIGIYTIFVAAFVIDVEPTRNGAFKLFIRPTVSNHCAVITIYREHAVLFPSKNSPRP